MEVVFRSFLQLTDQPECENEHEHIFTGGILHKLMHALGAIHTHQRMDRDKYINYQEWCVAADKRDQYRKVPFNLPSDGLPMSTILSCIMGVTPSANAWERSPVTKPVQAWNQRAEIAQLLDHFIQLLKIGI